MDNLIATYQTEGMPIVCLAHHETDYLPTLSAANVDTIEPYWMGVIPDGSGDAETFPESYEPLWGNLHLVVAGLLDGDCDNYGLYGYEAPKHWSDRVRIIYVTTAPEWVAADMARKIRALPEPLQRAYERFTEYVAERSKTVSLYERLAAWGHDLRSEVDGDRAEAA